MVQFLGVTPPQLPALECRSRGLRNPDHIKDTKNCMVGFSPPITAEFERRTKIVGWALAHKKCLNK